MDRRPDPDGTPPPHFMREMGVTREEFLRLLPAAVGPLPWELEDDRLLIHHPDGPIHLILTQEPPRRIAALQLPVLGVTFRFFGPSAAARLAFMGRFDLVFQRGGG